MAATAHLAVGCEAPQSRCPPEQARKPASGCRRKTRSTAQPTQPHACVCPSQPTSYQKIRFKIKNTTITTIAQKIGFCQIVVAPSSGIGVTPYTRPESCSVGTGFVIRLTTTVTTTQIIQLQSARYRFSAIGFASVLIAIY